MKGPKPGLMPGIFLLWGRVLNRPQFMILCLLFKYFFLHVFYSRYINSKSMDKLTPTCIIIIINSSPEHQNILYKVSAVVYSCFQSVRPLNVSSLLSLLNDWIAWLEYYPLCIYIDVFNVTWMCAEKLNFKKKKKKKQTKLYNHC